MMTRWILLALVLTLFAQLAEAKRTYGMRPGVYKKVQDIQLLLDEKHWQRAIEAVDELQKNGLSQYEMAQTWDIRGLAAYQLDDYEQAITDYKHVIAQKEHIPEGMYLRSLRTLSQLNMMNENYREALKFARQLTVEQPDADVLMLQAQAYFRLEEFDNALQSCEQAKTMLAQKNRKPRENWLLLENAIHHAMENYPAMLIVLEKLVQWYPKSDYLLYTANVYGQLERPQKQIGLLETLYERGDLTSDSQLMHLSSLYLMEEVPYKSARLLEEQLDEGGLEENEKVYNLLASSWNAAGEENKALRAMVSLSKLTEKGEDYLKLAYQYFDMTQWQGSEQAAEQALELGELKEPGDVWILLGMSRIHQKKFVSAQQAFAKAIQFKKSTRLAKQWLRYAEREQEKYAELSTNETNLASAQEE